MPEQASTATDSRDKRDETNRAIQHNDMLLARCGLLLSEVNGAGICFNGIDEADLYADVVEALGLDDRDNPDPEMAVIAAAVPVHETSIEAQLRNARAYLMEAKKDCEKAIRAQSDMAQRLERAQRILRAVIVEAQRPSPAVERMMGKDDSFLSAQDMAERALWAHECQARAIRFVAELATMTAMECDMLDGYEVQAIARLLQVPDDEGERAPTVPRLYSDDDRERAASILRRKAMSGYIANPNAYAGMSTDGERYGDTVDAVAEALGMRSAGA